MPPAADIGARQHGLGAVHPVRHAARIGGREAQGDVARPAAQVQHVAGHLKARELFPEQLHKAAVRGLEVSLRVGAGLLASFHQLGFRYALHGGGH